MTPEEEHRIELRTFRRYASALRKDMLKLPEVPSFDTLALLARCPMEYGDWEEGKRLQIIHGPKAVPPKTEFEYAAGRWSRIRAAMAPSNGGSE